MDSQDNQKGILEPIKDTLSGAMESLEPIKDKISGGMESLKPIQDSISGGMESVKEKVSKMVEEPISAPRAHVPFEH